MPKLLSIALLVFSGAAFAQSAQPGQTTPSVTPSDTPAVTPSQTPSVIPPTQPPAIGAPTVGGMSQCQNMIGADRDKCLQEEQRPSRGTASTGGRAAGAGGSHAPGSTGTGAGTMGSQNSAPAGSIR